MLKNITRADFKHFKIQLKSYFTHYKDHPDSLVTRIYGLHKVQFPKTTKSCCSCRQYQTIYFLVMDNVFRGYKINDRYDLKGSRVGRQTTIVRAGKKSKLLDLDDRY